MRHYLLILLLVLMTTFSGCCTWCGRKEYNEAKAKMAELCAKDGGLHVYERVVLPKGQKFKDDGYPPMFNNAYGIAFRDLLGPEYELIEDSKILMTKRERKIKLYQSYWYVIRKQDGKKLGEDIWYSTTDGYAIEGTGNGSSIRCPEEGFRDQVLFRSIFLESGDKE